ncbi:hypothetical protein ACFQE1_01780 [Halobium palmae]|uniref:Uncharacterized protein n=1 Tax=Halobium palmae TaxID=1776492 RepID=A0ABD5RV54_9EURY
MRRTSENGNEPKAEQTENQELPRVKNVDEIPVEELPGFRTATELKQEELVLSLTENDYIKINGEPYGVTDDHGRVYADKYPSDHPEHRGMPIRGCIAQLCLDDDGGIYGENRHGSRKEIESIEVVKRVHIPEKYKHIDETMLLSPFPEDMANQRY